jgi:hypothetical protein
LFFLAVPFVSFSVWPAFCSTRVVFGSYTPFLSVWLSGPQGLCSPTEIARFGVRYLVAHHLSLRTSLCFVRLILVWVMSGEVLCVEQPVCDVASEYC